MKKFFAIAAVAGLLSLTACGEKSPPAASNDVTAGNLEAVSDNGGLATDNGATLGNSVAPAADNSAAPVANATDAVPPAPSTPAAPAGEKHKAK